MRGRGMIAGFERSEEGNGKVRRERIIYEGWIEREREEQEAVDEGMGRKRGRRPNNDVVTRRKGFNIMFVHTFSLTFNVSPYGSGQQNYFIYKVDLLLFNKRRVSN